MNKVTRSPSSTSTVDGGPARTARTGLYPIRVVSRLTGISSETLRVWERRYGFPRPSRGPAGVRVFTDDDVGRLILVSRALAQGFRAGEAVPRSREELERMLGAGQPPAGAVPPAAPQIQHLIDALVKDDPAALRQGLRQALLGLGARRFVVEVASPLATEVGERWAIGQLDIRHEHLFTELLGSQLRILLASQDEPGNGPRVLLTTLPGERHTLGVLMAAVFIAIHGGVPRVLGAETPPSQIVDAARALEVNAAGLSFPPGTRLEEVADQLAAIDASLPPEIGIWAGGASAAKVPFASRRTKVVPRWDDLAAVLAGPW